jgi:hypothetical protein
MMFIAMLVVGKLTLSMIRRVLEMLVPKVKAKEFEKFGFKKCKGDYGKCGCYYLCVARGKKFIFVSDTFFDVQMWESDDPRIHKNANCRYKDHRTCLDIVYDLIKADMIVRK